MLKNSNSIVELKINELLNGGSQYIIPVYQRNYAWGYKEISQLVQDICNVIEDGKQSNYYIGTLVTYKRTDGKYEVIDGQQRLTTLTLLMYALSHSDLKESESFKIKNNLEFECRQDSNNILQILQQISNNNISLPSIDNTGLVKGYEICKKEINKLKSNNVEHNISINAFVEYLLTQVKIIRIEVPEDTDLNHYFEIMNNRGEQLEKHEILKARFLDKLKDDKSASHLFNLIWEACSDMDRYVQYGFIVNNKESIKSPRHIVFGNDWNSFAINVSNFNEVASNIFKINESNNDNSEGPFSIQNLIELSVMKKELPKNEDKRDLERFHSIIDFPNFLLQVLCVFVNNSKNDWFSGFNSDKKVILDDKKLIEEFDKYIFHHEKIGEKIIKEFAYELLRCRFYFDKFIVKREYTTNADDGVWSLKELNSSNSYTNTFNKKDNIHDDIVMLLSMFHVSNPANSYKYWLTSALSFLIKGNDSIDEYEYKKHLQLTARKFVFNRYLCNSEDEKLEFYDMIYGDKQLVGCDINKDRLSYNKIANNLIFNYLDYLLLNMYKNNDQFREKYKNGTGYGDIKNFKFTFRSSVEHFWSQNDENGKKLSNDKVEHEMLLHSFGNLCLVTHEQNSSLSNQDPKKKKIDVLNKIERFKRIDNIKQWIMLQYVEDDKDWNEEAASKAIKEHEQNMIDILKNDLEKHKNEN